MSGHVASVLEGTRFSQMKTWRVIGLAEAEVVGQCWAVRCRHYKKVLEQTHLDHPGSIIPQLPDLEQWALPLHCPCCKAVPDFGTHSLGIHLARTMTTPPPPRYTDTCWPFCTRGTVHIGDRIGAPPGVFGTGYSIASDTIGSQPLQDLQMDSFGSYLSKSSLDVLVLWPDSLKVLYSETGSIVHPFGVNSDTLSSRFIDFWVCFFFFFFWFSPYRLGWSWAWDQPASFSQVLGV